MKKRWIITGIAIVALFAATAGIAFAAGRGSNPGTRAPVVSQMMAAGDAMHDSPAMQAMHEQMPAALQARCDAMHEQMDQMMNGSGMMNGSAGTTGGSMADHHPTTEG